MKNLLEAMNSLKEGNKTRRLELDEQDKKSLRDEIFGIVCYWRSGEDGQYSKEDVSEGLREMVDDPSGEDGLMGDDALYEIFPQLNEENGEAFESALIREARIIIDDIFANYGLDSYIEDADNANKASNESKSLKENYTEKDLQPGAKYYGPAGAMIQIVEPTKEGYPQYQMTNTNNGKVGKVTTMKSYGQLASLLSDNHYVKLGKVNESVNSESKRLLNKVDIEANHIIDKLKKGVLKTKKEAVDEFNSQCYVIRMEARSSELNKEDMDKIKDRISVKRKEIEGSIKESLQEDMTILTGEDVTEDFKNYKAFIANFKPIKIMKKNNHFFIYTEDSKDDNDYKHYGDSKDYIEGWLYGAVQAANKIIKMK